MVDKYKDLDFISSMYLYNDYIIVIFELEDLVHKYVYNSVSGINIVKI